MNISGRTDCTDGGSTGVVTVSVISHLPHALGSTPNYLVAMHTPYEQKSSWPVRNKESVRPGPREPKGLLHTPYILPRCIAHSPLSLRHQLFIKSTSCQCNTDYPPSR
ncbi:unnamed protein product [Sphacelaria rigidula]